MYFIRSSYLSVAENYENNTPDSLRRSILVTQRIHYRCQKLQVQFHLDGETIGKVENSWGFFCDCEQISTLDCEFAKKIVISLQTAAIACHSTTMYVLILLRQNNVRIAGRTQLWNTHYILDNHSRHLIALLMRWSS